MTSVRRARVRADGPGAALCAVALPLALAAAASLQAATITVESLADDLSTDGQVTLREAILAANTDSSVDGSEPGSGADEIVFATGNGTIALALGELPQVFGTLTVTGLGHTRLGIDAGDTSRVFRVGAGATLAISGLRIEGGNSGAANGGAIENAGTLTLTDAALLRNKTAFDGGAIFNGGQLTLERCAFVENTAQNGGAVSNHGTAQIVDSIFLNDATGGIAAFVGGGGAILNAGSLSVTGSEFSGSMAGNGGALVNTSGGTLTLVNSTVTGSSALNNGGGLSNALGTTTIVNSTIVGARADSNGDAVGAGGGIYRASGTVTLHNTLVAKNLQGTATTAVDVAGALDPASSYNLIGVDTQLSGISNGVGGNQIGTAASPLDPKLGSSFASGLPPRGIYPLLAGSPAIDAGSNTLCPAADQAGESRPMDGDDDGSADCDVGASERGAVFSGPVQFHSLAPCRLLDTRGPDGPLSGPALWGLAERGFPLVGACGVPVSAKAVSLNIAVIGATAAGNVRLHPGGTPIPLIASVTYAAGQTRSNNAVVGLNEFGRVAAYVAQAVGTVHLILDVNGYFE